MAVLKTSQGEGEEKQTLFYGRITDAPIVRLFDVDDNDAILLAQSNVWRVRLDSHRPLRGQGDRLTA